MLRWISALDRVLKGEATRPDELRRGTVDIPLGGLAFVILLLGVVYGVCMGVFAVITRFKTETDYMGLQQLGASAVKVPALFFLTLLVTAPSLYVFNALVGSRLSFGAVMRLLIAALGVMMALLASFGPIVVFFSVSTTSYAFMVLLNVVLFAISGILGLRFLLQTLHRLSIVQSWEPQPPAPAPAPPSEYSSQAGGTPPPVPLPGTEIYPPPSELGALDRLSRQTIPPAVRNVFQIWVLVFGLVGAQMSWILRPFIGTPNAPFTFFRARESHFFEAVADKVYDLFSSDKPPRGPGR